MVTTENVLADRLADGNRLAKPAISIGWLSRLSRLAHASTLVYDIGRGLAHYYIPAAGKLDNNN